MKTFCTALILLCLTVCISAQTLDSTITIEGRVQDFVTHVDVPGCLVEVLNANDSSVVASTKALEEYQNGEQSWKKPCALQEVKQDRPVENHQQDEGKNTVRPHAAVLHDFQHALARASRKQSVHRVHEAVAMKPSRQENRQYQ